MTLDLFAAEDLYPVTYEDALPPHATIQQRFEAFHAQNPHVYEHLVSMARRLHARGRRRIGIAMLFETMRYQYAVSTDGDDFKLNNNFRSRYARLIMQRHPDLDGVFETREIQRV
jgi:hypothetical protein